jgi:hypothetical protein
VYTEEQRKRAAQRIKDLEVATKKLDDASFGLTLATMAYNVAKREVERLQGG